MTAPDNAATMEATETPVHELLQRAVQHHQEGRLEKAEDIYRRILHAQPDHTAALQLLGLLADSAGKPDLAENLMRRSLAHAPDQAPVWANLGNVLWKMGRFDDAAAACRKAIQVDPVHAPAYNNLGNALMARERPGRAAAAYRKAVEIDPRYIDARFNLGVAFDQQNETTQAIQAYRHVIETHPHHAEAHNNLGTVLAKLRQWSEAVASYRRAIEIEPAYAEAHKNLASAYRELGDIDRAATAYRQALNLRPDDADAHKNLGIALREHGRLDEAVASLECAVRLLPTSAETHRVLAATKTYRRRDAQLLAMERLAADADLGDDERMRLAFALGKAYEDLRCYDKAFACFELGNRLRRRTIEYDPRRMHDLVQKLRTLFDADLIRRYSQSGCMDPTPVFILGMPRSGTALVEQIIASHPDVHGAGELDDLSRIVTTGCRDFTGGPYPDGVPQLTPRQVAKLGERYVSTLREHSGSARRITDKMPGNAQYIGMLGLMLPAARIIHCTRHPVDNCLSIYKTLFTSHQPFAYDQTELARYYLEHRSLMDHWHTVLPGFILDVQYESLVTDQEAQSKRLLEFCGLRWHRACLEFHKARRPVKTASASQVRRPMYKTSVDAWRRYEEHLQPLIDTLRKGHAESPPRKLN